MKLTYIHHSSFLLETDNEAFLFDYTEGRIPPLNPDTPLYIIATHRHGDHFSEIIFDLAQEVKSVTYLLSFDIPASSIPQRVGKQVRTLDSNSSYTVDNLHITTYTSTDEGIALVIEVGGKRLYYAGDLNHWHWEEEEDAWNKQMAKSYLAEVAKLPTHFDLAFVPVDPRLGAAFSLGAEELLEHATVDVLVPMHFWEDASVCEKLQQKVTTKVLRIDHTNQSWRM